MSEEEGEEEEEKGLEMWKCTWSGVGVRARVLVSMQRRYLKPMLGSDEATLGGRSRKG